MLIPRLARPSNPSFVGCAPRYRVGLTSPKFGTPARVNLRPIEWFAAAGDEEEFAAGGASAVPDMVTARRARTAEAQIGRVMNGIRCVFGRKSSTLQAMRIEAQSSFDGSLTQCARQPWPQTTQQAKSCLTVVSVGSHAFRNIMLGGVAGAVVSKQQYKVVDSVNYPAHEGQKFHGNDLQTMQSGGVHVTVLDKKSLLSGETPIVSVQAS